MESNECDKLAEPESRKVKLLSKYFITIEITVGVNIYEYLEMF